MIIKYSILAQMLCICSMLHLNIGCWWIGSPSDTRIVGGVTCCKLPKRAGSPAWFLYWMPLIMFVTTGLQFCCCTVDYRAVNRMPPTGTNRYYDQPVRTYRCATRLARQRTGFRKYGEYSYAILFLSLSNYPGDNIAADLWYVPLSTDVPFTTRY